MNEDVGILNRLCVVCGRELGPHISTHCTDRSLVAVKKKGFFNKRVSFFGLDGRRLSEVDIASLKEAETPRAEACRQARHEVVGHGDETISSERIATLGDAAYRLGECAERLLMHGEYEDEQLSFSAIRPADQALFLDLAMLEGSDHSRFVAGYLARSIAASLKCVEDVEARLCQEDKVLVASLAKSIILDARRIAAELRRAWAAIGDLSGEEAYWIVIPSDPFGDSEWVPVGQTGAYSHVRSPFVVLQDPRTDVRVDANNLIAVAKAARWLLNVHNHPKIPGYSISCEPSDADYRFVAQWRSLAPTLCGKMRFFVISRSAIVEYGLRERKTRKWSACEPSA